jgi:hypothetical protein
MKTGSPAKTGGTKLFGMVWIFWRFSGGTSKVCHALIWDQ